MVTECYTYVRKRGKNFWAYIIRHLGGGFEGLGRTPFEIPMKRTNPLWSKRTPLPPLEKILFSLFDYLHRWAHGGLGGRTPYFLKKMSSVLKNEPPLENLSYAPDYLMGGPTFKVITAHKPLVSLYSKPLVDVPNAHVERHIENLARFSLEANW